MNNHNKWWKSIFQKENNFTQKSPWCHMLDFDGSMKNDAT
jgi:hypothetical protein